MASDKWEIPNVEFYLKSSASKERGKQDGNCRELLGRRKLFIFLIVET